jgi:para-aminobenzoate synthetase
MRAPAVVLRRHVRRLPGAADTEAVFTGLFATSPEAFWLDGAPPGRQLSSRYSFLGDGSGPLAHTVQRPDVLDRLTADLTGITVVGDESPVPFAGGFVGYLGYEARDECGYPVRRRGRSPDAGWLFADRLVAVDHVAGATYLVALTPAARARPPRWFDRVASTLDRARPPTRTIEPLGTRPLTPADVERTLVTSRSGYLEAIERCLGHLRDGDSYEICLTTRARIPAGEPATSAHRRLRRANPAPYSAFLRIGGIEIVSSSPERFLRVWPDGRVQTRPIKGTAPRGATEEEDRRRRSGLAASLKTRAENLMIVDLLRNDLHRVCRPGTVAVPSLMAVETYATLHQLVTTVEGRLEEGATAVDALRACFPGGSMTGAPKYRTLELIDEIEGRPRGVYSGVIGYLGLDGGADLSIAIRSAVLDRGWWEVGAGGAVVLDSDPAAEYEEMLLKAAATLQVLLPGGASPWS